MKIISKLKKGLITSVALFMSLSMFAVKSQQVFADEMKPAGEEVSTMPRNINFNDNWKFKLQDGGSLESAKNPDYDDSGWQELNLPHDWSIYFDFDHNSPAQNEGGLLNGGVGWYRKKLVLDNTDRDKNIRIRFGGVYMDSSVYVNGQLVGNYPNGYTPFSYDITEYLNFEGSENVIAVKAVNKQPSSRWYSGSGIYRDVELIMTDDVAVSEYGVTVRHPKIKEQIGQSVDTYVSVNVENKGDSAQDITIRTTILDASQTAVSSQESAVTRVDAQSKTVIEDVLEIDNPVLWDIDNPYIYNVKTEVVVKDEVVDMVVNRFGYRYTDWTPEGGFSLNGKDVKFHGVSMHHDQGSLGAVAHYDAIYRQMSILKEMGVNAVRITHNPADDKLIEICEDLGLMVIDEAFDTWYGGKKPYDYGRFFEKQASHPELEESMTWAEYDIKQMVKRGINSPAIIMWSVGNEIGESNNGDAKAVKTAKNLHRWVNEIDKTGVNGAKGNFRFTTMGQDVYRWAPTGGHERVSAELDAVGLNYAEDAYHTIRKNHPDWLIYGAETSSATRSRGVYAFPDQELNHDNSAKRKFQQSDYGNDRVGWGKTATNSWKPDRDNKGYAGQFIWTGFDYIGEPTPWHNQNETPPKSSYFGIVDTAGYPKNDYYLYQSQWRSVEDYPMVHMLPHWNWEDEALLDYNMRTKDGKIPVRVFSNAPKVELFLDGESLGEKSFIQKTTNYGKTYQEGKNENELYLEWRLDFKPGKLEAVAKDNSGKVIARDVIESATGSHKIELLTNQNVINADGKSLSYIEVRVTDNKGNMNPNAQDLIKFEISGNGRIVGVDNGNPASNERYKAQHDGTWQRQVFNGKALVIVESTQESGNFTLRATSSSLESDMLNVFTVDDADNDKRSLLGFKDVRVTTIVNTRPNMPETVKAVYSDNTVEDKNVVWDEIPANKLSEVGTFNVMGYVEGTELPAKATVVIQGVQTTKPVYIATGKGEVPKLPNTVDLIFNTYFETEVEVEWDAIDPSQCSDYGHFEVSGKANYHGTIYDAKAIISVVEETKVKENIARKAKASASFEAGDKVANIIDGDVDFNNRWTNWTPGGIGNDAMDSVTLELDKAYELDEAIINFFVDSQTKSPAKLTILTSNDGTTYKPVENQSKIDGFNETTSGVTVTFEPVTAKFIKFELYGQKIDETKYSPIGLIEVTLMADSDNFTIDPNSVAEIKTITVDSQEIEAFDANKKRYVIDVPFAQTDLKLDAEAKDKSFAFVITPTKENNFQGKVYVTSEDGKQELEYSIYYNIAEPLLVDPRLELSSYEAKEDDILDVSLNLQLEDGSPVDEAFIDVEYIIEGDGKLEIEDNQLYVYDKGDYRIKAKITYFDQVLETKPISLSVKENTDTKTITSFKDIEVITGLNVKPELPTEVIACFDKGLDRPVAVIWEEVKDADLSKYGSFKVLGHVEGTDIQPELTIVVEGIVSVDNFSGVTPVHKPVQLPKTTIAYLSNGESHEYAIDWNYDESLIHEIGIHILEGTLENTTVPVRCTLRVSDDVKDGNNISKLWTGSLLPAGIASFTNDASPSKDSIAAVNDDIIDAPGTGSNRWTNWQSTGRESDWVGIMFADAGTITTRYIDNMDIYFFADSGTSAPEDYKIEYYTGETPREPENFGHVAKDVDHPFNNEANWKEVENLSAPRSLSDTEKNELRFDGVNTYAIRINMKPREGMKGNAIREIQIFDRIAEAYSELDAKVTFDGKVFEDFDLNIQQYTFDLGIEGLPEIDVTTEKNNAITVIKDELKYKTIKVKLVSEDGKIAKDYIFTFTHDLYDGLTSLHDLLEEAGKIEISKYTAESVSVLTKTMSYIESELQKDLDLEAIVTLENELKKALEGLILKDEGISQESVEYLENLIEEAKSVNKEDYTEESYSNLVKALEEAEFVISNLTELKTRIIITQTMVDGAIKRLELALESLELNDQLEIGVSKESIQELKTVLDDAKSIDRSLYEEDGVAHLDRAIKNAEMILKDLNLFSKKEVTQEMVDAVITDLKNAMAGLKLIENNEEIINPEDDLIHPSTPVTPETGITKQYLSYMLIIIISVVAYVGLVYQRKDSKSL